MENPATWGRTERTVHEALSRWQNEVASGSVGLSSARTITDALRAEGLLKEENPSSPEL